MSKYVKKKHGLTIGSDNIFFVVDGDEMRDGYRSIVSTHRYTFDQLNSVNVFVETPANQIIWKNDGDKDYVPFEDMEKTRRPYIISNYAKNWLEKNVGEYKQDWDTYSRMAACDRTLFFKRRTDALEFTKEIDRLLQGMCYSNW